MSNRLASRALLTALLLTTSAQLIAEGNTNSVPKTAIEWRAYFKDLRANKDRDSYYKLASYYAAGHEELSTKPDAAKAYDLYVKAAELGHPEAQYRVGYCLEHKLGVRRIAMDQAFKWYLKAADQEVPAAQLRVGEMYFYAEGVPFNDQQAFHYLIKAAERGLPDAQRLAGDCYKLGWGVTRSYVQALSWYNIAAAQENDLAVRSRDTLISIYHLTKDDIATAEKIAKEYKAKP
jgi:TPR repeat protein